MDRAAAVVASSVVMANFAPCIVGPDQIVHLSVPELPGRTLCGQPVDQPTPAMGNSNGCFDCAKKLVRHIFKMADAAGIGTISVEIHPPGGDDAEPL